MTTLAARAVAGAGVGALAAFAAVHWAGLLADPPIVPALAIAAIAALGGIAVASVPRDGGHWVGTARRLAIVLAALCAALLAAGIPARLLLPGGWDELAAGVDAGASALRVRQWPYAGPDEWVRLAVMVVAALTLTASAALAAWPSGRMRPVLRALAVTLPVALYCVAIAQQAPESPIASGLLLLAVLAIWIATSNGRRLRPVSAVAVVVVVAAGSALVAARLPAGDPLIDYRTIGFGEGSSFEWEHSYGPLDWPRNGEIVFEVDSERPRYWKATTLDRFDGVRWTRAPASVGDPGAGLPPDPPAQWLASITVTVNALESEHLVAPGPILATEGVESVIVSDDGTASTVADIDAGDSYDVSSYAPDPGARRLRASGDGVPDGLNPYTALAVPSGTELEPGDDATAAAHTLIFPPREAQLRVPSAAEEAVLASPYARSYRLARRLGASAPSRYDAVRAVQSYLRSGYSYGENVPQHPFPLASFLFGDRVGYCQHFSGAMALLLRMNRIPARVAAGFAPGERRAGGSFEVLDSDAHSWVEVWFRGVGWVPFDPTPEGSPASSRSGATAVTAALGREGQAAQIRRFDLGRGDRRVARLGGALGRDPGLRGRSSVATLPATGTAGGGDAAGAATLLVLLVALATFGGVRSWRRARAGRTRRDELGELRDALDTLRFGLPPGGTLADLERRLTDAGHLTAARYVEQLRLRRYARRRGPSPDAHGRRALRLALTAGRGPLWRLRGYGALPPRRG